MHSWDHSQSRWNMDLIGFWNAYFEALYRFMFFIFFRVFHIQSTFFMIWRRIFVDKRAVCSCCFQPCLKCNWWIYEWHLDLNCNPRAILEGGVQWYTWLRSSMCEQHVQSHREFLLKKHQHQRMKSCGGRKIWGGGEAKTSETWGWPRLEVEGSTSNETNSDVSELPTPTWVMTQLNHYATRSLSSSYCVTLLSAGHPVMKTQTRSLRART